ncbi:YdiU family protein [Pseudorhodobacter sp. W20_MBD10_FR17]|uniref:protein adenylyltransferase SelO n=1 Tax=Pseudorhodobacter sp. W20_MBD10_FR17 TaxID=3240266 RepID=UPI003F95C8A6
MPDLPLPDLPLFAFDNSFAREMEGFFVEWQGDKLPNPQVLRLNRGLAETLGLDADALAGAGAVLAGAEVPVGANPLAMAYAGHQFGGFSPQLGDGRALLLGEIVAPSGKRFDLHLKGSGRTPFSRGGDGKAVLGPVLREYLFGEAMAALGIATTRALAAATTGEKIRRDGPQQGAVLARIAASHLRVGTFQFFAARGEVDRVRQLADYAITRHFPHLASSDAPYLAMFEAVVDAQAALVAQWVLVGFVHGVMNTDNTTISGETIDYGPCAFIDSYDPAAVFSSIDRNGRYAYGNQSAIMHWNLTKLAETLIDLVNPQDSEAAIAVLTTALHRFPALYEGYWLAGMRAKLGLGGEEPEDLALAQDFLAAAEGQDIDYTQLFRDLAEVVRGKRVGVFAAPSVFDDWLVRHRARLAIESAGADAMDAVNPVYILRNHLVEAALTDAASGDMAAFDRLLAVVSQPFAVQAGAEEFAKPAPAGFGAHVTFCGT